MRIITELRCMGAGAVFVVLPTTLALLALAGCARKPPEQYISGNFVPAGMQQGIHSGPASARDPRGMAAGDPNVPASVKAHVIPGLPPSGAATGPAPGGQARP